MGDSRVLQVSGIPSRLYDDDLLRDKLLIHFLRPINGGGCEVDVRYPTEEEGVATLTFEQEAVAERILGKKHTLEINECTYPLTARRPPRHSSEFFLPIRTFLNLKYFGDIPGVMRLLERSNLRIYESQGSKLCIEGNFHDLRQCRDELYETFGGPLLRRPNGREKTTHGVVRDPSKFHIASADTENRSPRRNKSPSNLTNKRRPKNASEVANDSDLDSTTSRHHKDLTKSRTNISSPEAANESASPLPRDKSPAVHTESVQSSSSVSHSLYLDAGVYSYVIKFERSMIDDILRDCYIAMAVEECEKCVRVTLTAKPPYSSTRFQYGLDKMTKLFACYEAGLHRERIKLPVTAGSSREEVAKSLQQYLLKQDIYARRYQDYLHLIGPPQKILWFMQEFQFSQPINEKKMSNDSQPPTEELEKAHIAPRSKNLAQTQVADAKPRALEPRQATPSRGRGSLQEGNRRGSHSARPQKPQWR